MVLSKKQITKALNRLRRCAGWSVPLLFPILRRQAHISVYKQQKLMQISVAPQGVKPQIACFPDRHVNLCTITAFRCCAALVAYGGKERSLMMLKFYIKF